MTNNGAEAGSTTLLVVAAALVDGAGRALVQRRPAGKAHAGLWEFPGGKVELGETAAEALARELAEELAIGVDPAAMQPIAFSTGAAADGRELVLLLYLARAWTGTPTAIEADALAWLPPAALADLPMPAADRPLVDRLRRWLAMPQD